MKTNSVQEVVEDKKKGKMFGTASGESKDKRLDCPEPNGLWQKKKVRPQTIGKKFSSYNSLRVIKKENRDESEEMKSPKKI